jgi:hypothetical protein
LKLGRRDGCLFATREWVHLLGDTGLGATARARSQIVDVNILEHDR